MSARSQRWWTRRISLDRAVNRTTEWVRVRGMNEHPHQRDDTPRRHHPTTCPRNVLRRAEFRITLPPRNEGGVTPEGWARKALLRALGSTPGSDAHFTRCLEVFVPHRFDMHTRSAATLAAIVAANFRQSAVSTLPAAHASGVPNARALRPVTLLHAPHPHSRYARSRTHPAESEPSASHRVRTRRGRPLLQLPCARDRSSIASLRATSANFSVPQRPSHACNRLIEERYPRWGNR